MALPCPPWRRDAAEWQPWAIHQPAFDAIPPLASPATSIHSWIMRIVREVCRIASRLIAAGMAIVEALLEAMRTVVVTPPAEPVRAIVVCPYQPPLHPWTVRSLAEPREQPKAPTVATEDAPHEDPPNPETSQPSTSPVSIQAPIARPSGARPLVCGRQPPSTPSRAPATQHETPAPTCNRAMRRMQLRLSRRGANPIAGACAKDHAHERSAMEPEVPWELICHETTSAALSSAWLTVFIALRRVKRGASRLYSAGLRSSLSAMREAIFGSDEWANVVTAGA